MHHHDVVTLHLMTESDLALVADRLRQPHVARWWPPDTTAQGETEKYRARIVGEHPVTMLTVIDEGKPIGWCQWYRWADYPADAEASGAEPSKIGIDYAIGHPAAVGRGVGTELIGRLVEAIRETVGPTGFLVAP